MRWQGRRGSDNVVDKRGVGGMMLGGGGGIGMLIILLLYWFMGGDPSQLAQQLPQGGGGTQQATPLDPNTDDPQAKFVSVVLAETEQVWGTLFERSGQTYQDPKLVLFSGQVQSGCGFASAATGPFYCPPDQRVYLDTSFFTDLDRKLGAPGDFAAAYVIAHEIGHHVQNQLGVMDKLQAARGRMSQTEFNELSVRVELQADYYAGVWAHYAERAKLLEPGDIDEALRAASAVGDDRLQEQSQGHVVPDSFTHGTSEQRMRWFKKGYESGDPAGGDTFGASRL